MRVYNFLRPKNLHNARTLSKLSSEMDVIHRPVGTEGAELLTYDGPEAEELVQRLSCEYVQQRHRNHPVTLLGAKELNPNEPKTCDGPDVEEHAKYQSSGKLSNNMDVNH